MSDQHASHDHGHSHDHDGTDTYFIDQLCMVGLSGAFGMICLCLWFWQTEMLAILLADQFHIYVLLSGIALVVIAMTRGAILWFQSRDAEFLHSLQHHHHHHDHEHEHAPVTVGAAACGHEHGPGESCAHDHAIADHEHAIGHAHAHHDAHDAGAHGDHDEEDHDHGWAPWRYVVILVPIILFLLALPNRAANINDLNYERMIGNFASIIYEAMPFIVLGVLIAGLLEEFVPQQAIASVVPRNHVFAIGIGALLGLVFPMCECGIIVVMKRLLRKGLPLSVCIAYMLAGPVINVVVMTSTYVAFSGYKEAGVNDVLGGPWFVVGLRIGLSYIVAIGTALLVDWQWRRHGNRLLHPAILRGLRTTGAGESNGIARRSAAERVNNITQTALHDFVDIMAFLVLGALLAAGGKFIIAESNIRQFLQDTPAVAISLMMGIAILFCLCSEADAFVAANFPLFWPDSSKLAFLVLGPMLDLKLLLMYTRVFRARLIYTIVAALLVQVFVYSSVAGYFFGKEHPREQEPFIMPSEAESHLFSIGLGPDPLAQLVHAGVAFNPISAGKGEPVDYMTLYTAPLSDEQRKIWDNKLVEVRGEYDPGPSDRVFGLARSKIQCCYSDLMKITIAVGSRESISGLKRGQWVKVTGKVGFRRQGNSYFPVLMVSSAKDVADCNPDVNPYVK
jgi:uncharacterized membrane protein YraQ (UPF0718 family)